MHRPFFVRVAGAAAAMVLVAGCSGAGPAQTQAGTGISSASPRTQSTGNPAPAPSTVATSDYCSLFTVDEISTFMNQRVQASDTNTQPAPVEAKESA